MVSRSRATSLLPLRIGSHINDSHCSRKTGQVNNLATYKPAHDVEQQPQDVAATPRRVNTQE
eukprot:4497784-Pleurochrysis_carterae.AAC.1